MVNDISILTGIIVVFVVIGGFLPYLNESFNVSGNTPNVEDLESNVAEDAENVETFNAFSVLLSILKMFFWTFGAVPFWLDLFFFTPIRLIFVAIVARNIWIGGGA